MSKVLVLSSCKADGLVLVTEHGSGNVSCLAAEFVFAVPRLVEN